MNPMFGTKLVMNASTPHSTTRGTPMIASAVLSSTATIRPNTAVTTR